MRSSAHYRTYPFSNSSQNLLMHSPHLPDNAPKTNEITHEIARAIIYFQYVIHFQRQYLVNKIAIRRYYNFHNNFKSTKNGKNRITFILTLLIMSLSSNSSFKNVVRHIKYTYFHTYYCLGAYVRKPC